MKKVLITSGGTREYIDDVRVLTNISSGRLGAMIAHEFLEGNKPEVQYEVHYVCPNDAVIPMNNEMTPFWQSVWLKQGFVIHLVKDVQSVYKTMEELVPRMDVVIHAMAVSDFGFKPISTKLKSGDPEAFIESLRERITQNPKILPMVKKWNPDCRLVSFKFEVGLGHEKLVEIAKKSMEGAGSDLVIANDKSEIVQNKAHIAYAISNDSEVKLSSKQEIAKFLFNTLK